ncbi:MAG: slipin family protein [Bacteroidota bacterium]|nr:slipin family protein [Candidatus Kapabacteria bacterium]MDW8221087.1 slipin family protein [Bacteroidota bacterium]
MDILLIIIVILSTPIILSGIRIAKEYRRAVVFRLGRYHSTRGPGLYYMIPLIETANMIDIRTNTVAIEQQEAITKDSVTVKINAVLWYRVADPENAIVRVADYQQAVYQIAQTSLRNIIGQHNLDEVLKERDKINDTLEEIVDRVTAGWGVKVEMVEMRDVEIPESMQRAMAREAEAVRERRARIIKAEAELEASQKLAEAARQIAANPTSLELRRMQMISEIGTENNTTTIVMMPSEFVNMARSFSEALSHQTSHTQKSSTLQ